MSEKKSNTGLFIGLGCAFLFVLPVIGVLLAVVIPAFLTYEDRMKQVDMAECASIHSEALANLEEIRAAEIAYHAEHGKYVETGANPTLLTADKQVWDAKSSSGFEILGWAPASGVVQASYSVTTTDDDFEARVVIDADRDRVIAVYTATKDSPPARITDEDIY